MYPVYCSFFFLATSYYSCLFLSLPSLTFVSFLYHLLSCCYYYAPLPSSSFFLAPCLAFFFLALSLAYAIFILLSCITVCTSCSLNLLFLTLSCVSSLGFSLFLVALAYSNLLLLLYLIYMSCIFYLCSHIMAPSTCFILLCRFCLHLLYLDSCILISYPFLFFPFTLLCCILRLEGPLPVYIVCSTYIYHPICPAIDPLLVCVYIVWCTYIYISSFCTSLAIDPLLVCVYIVWCTYIYISSFCTSLAIDHYWPVSTSFGVHVYIILLLWQWTH